MTGLPEGSVAPVTGAGRGIGAGAARLLATEGAKVVANDRGMALDGSSPRPGPGRQVILYR